MSLSPDQKLAAYFLGRRIAGQRMKQERVPVAYLYNGVRLPGLPKEWNPETHPNAILAKWIVSTHYALYCYSGELSWSSEGFSIPTTNEMYLYNIENKTWHRQTSSGNVHYVRGDLVFWTNHDLIKEDGDLFFAASEPVPVYE